VSGSAGFYGWVKKFYSKKGSTFSKSQERFMRYSRYLIPTLKETPAEAEVISHKLMLRAGLIRKLSAGIYSYLPLGLRVIRKIENIVREEMNRAGALEVLLPGVQPAELWEESGRWQVYGKELLRLKDRHGRDFCLGPTHEEVITDLVRNEVRSYRDLPLNLYQIQAKFRDEIRPRFGLMRGREFSMKDAYSFDVDDASLDESYKKMYEAYTRIFERCGLKFCAVEADTGAIGGSSSHEFMVLANSGEDLVVSCSECSYGANIEKAESYRDEASAGEAKKLSRKEVNTPDVTSVKDVTEFLKGEKPGITESDLVKTLIIKANDKAYAILLRGDDELNEVKLLNYLNSASDDTSADHIEALEMASEEDILNLTGGPQGFSGPVGLKMDIIADVSVKSMSNFVTGANKKDTHFLNINLDDFTVKDFVELRTAKEGDTCIKCKRGKLVESRGIEVGHVFKLGKKYSTALNATFLDSNGKAQIITMGCYGIGIGRTAAAAIEQNHDESGIIFPLPIAPFDVLVLAVNTNDEAVMQKSEEIYNELKALGLDVLYDDRNERAGIKFKDADLIGVPIRVVVGKKKLADGLIEVSRRDGEFKNDVFAENVIEIVKDNINEMSNTL
jgi:prolyl-tRNA synthetase